MQADQQVDPLNLPPDQPTVWLNQTGWHVHFGRCSLQHIILTSQQPSRRYCMSEIGSDDYIIRDLYAEKILQIFPENTERRLLLLMRKTKQMFTRCLAAFHTTLEPLLRWLGNWNLDRPWKRPVRDIQPAARRRYISVCQQFLCYVFRIFSLDSKRNALTGTICHCPKGIRMSWPNLDRRGS